MRIKNLPIRFLVLVCLLLSCGCQTSAPTVINAVLTGTQVAVPLTLELTSNINAQPYQPIAQIQAGGQAFAVLLDTGSSWLVLNRAFAASNFAYTDTGQTATVEYGGGDIKATGRVCITQISIGGLAPLPVKFLLKESGNYGGQGTLGINTWNNGYPVDVPVDALKINRYQITLPTASGEPGKWKIQPGEWVVNGQPSIEAAKKAGNKPYTFNVPSPAAGNTENNKVGLATQITAGAITTNQNSTVLLDTGTPGYGIFMFPPLTDQLAYSKTNTAELNIQANTVEEIPVPLVQSFPLNKSIAVTTPPVFPGTFVVLGNAWLSKFVMGVDLTERQINLLPIKAITTPQ